MRRIAGTRWSVSVLLGMCVGAMAQAQSTVGRTAGEASVSATGAAQYRIPLELPPGTNGLAPELAIVYDHRGGNGLLGVGFRLEGFSAIRRCGGTVAQDGARSAVGLDAGDRFCLDGQRLRLTSGTYGGPDSQYQTEVETFSRVTARDTWGTGPRWFEVHRRDGLIYQYGATTDSGIEAAGSRELREWALSRIRDRNGNHIDFSYVEDGANGSYRPSRIDYTSNPSQGAVASYSIRFVYESRAATDWMSGYVAGGLVQETYRLARIDAQHVSGAVVRSYQLAYDPSGSTARSRLTRLQECAGGTCLPHTSFAWSGSSPGWATQAPASLDTAALSTGVAGDANGDGFEDFYFFDSTARSWKVLFGGPGGFQGAPLSLGVGADSQPAQALAADLDGNGRRDVLVPGTRNYWHWLRHTGGTSFAYSSTPLPNYAPAGSSVLLDVDGDARDDLVYANSVGSALLWQRNSSSYGNLTFAAEAELWRAPPGTRIAGSPFGMQTRGSRSVVRRADFNGDGRADLLVRVQSDGCLGVPGCTPAVPADRRLVLASRGTQLVAQTLLEGSEDPLLADLNGDGLTDVAYSPDGREWRLLLGTGRRGSTDAGAALAAAGTAPATGAAGRAVVVDWDGDGRTDLLVPGSGEWLACRSMGTSLDACPGTGISSADSGSPLVLDANGDSLPDLLLSGPARLGIHGAGVPDHLLAATDGQGLRAEFQYAPLTQASVYTPQSGSSYSVVDLASPAWVVATLSVSDGIGGLRATTYAYEGARLHLLGRGFLGFARRTSTDGGTGLVTVEEYHQDPANYEFIGRLASSTTRQSSGLPVSRTTYNWMRRAFGSAYEARRYPYVNYRVVDRYELDGTWVSSTSVQDSIDDFGTVLVRSTRITEKSGGLNPGAWQLEQVVVEGVTNDTQSWCIGRAGSTAVTRSHSLPGGAAVTRTTGQSVDPVRCRVTQEVVEPANAALRVTTDLAYDPFGNIATRTVSAAGVATRTTQFEWASKGRFLQSVTNAEGYRTVAAWDPVQAWRTSETDPNGLVTQWQYDAFGRLVREIRPDGTRTEVARVACAAGCVTPTATYTETTVERGSDGAALRSETVGFDLMDREVYGLAEQPGGTAVTVSRYSTRGLLSEQSTPAWCCEAPSFWTRYEHDVLGRTTRVERPTSATDATPAVTRWTYIGLVRSEIDPLGRATVLRHDAAGRVLQSIDPDNAATSYEYDAFGNLTAIRDPLGNETRSTYDGLGRKLSIVDPDSGLRQITYSPLGEILSQGSATHPATTFTYDRLSRPLTRAEDEGTTRWIWGADARSKNVGALASVSGPGFLETYAYDGLGRPAERTTTIAGSAFVTRYGYDETTGRLGVLTYPTSSGVAPLRLLHRYDRGRLVRLVDADDPSTTFWRLDAAEPGGVVSGETLGNGVMVASRFDPVTGRLESRAAGPGGGSDYQDLAYTWDAAGNLVQRREGALGVHESFSYDRRDRLDSVANSSGAFVDFEYDDLGNLTFKSDIGSYTYHPTKKHAVVAAGNNTYAYDANGNVVDANGTTVSWTSFDLPSRIAHPSGNYASFEYGPDRARIRQVARAGSDVIETVYAAGGLVERVNRNGVSSLRNYVLADGRRVAVQTRAAGAAPTTVYLLEDHLGGVDGFTSSSGELLARSSNQPFGARRAGDWVGSSPTPDEWQHYFSTTPRGFTGHEHVDNLGVIHMNGRVYDPVLGRFLSPDPLVQSPYDAQTLNRYSYVRNNPLRYTDPTGFCFNGHPAADQQAAQCLARQLEQVVVQASRLGDVPAGAFWGAGIPGGASAAYAAAGAVSGAGQVYTPAGPETFVVTARRLPQAPALALDASMYAPAPTLDQILAAASIGLALMEPTLFGEAMVIAGSAQGIADGNPAAMRFGPVRPGPLPPSVANTFRGGSYVQRQVRQPTRLYRVYGGQSGQLGSYWSRTPPAGPLQSRIDLALDPRWGNTASSVVRIDVPRGTTIFEGTAAAQRGLVGGGSQVVIPNVNPSWIVP